MQEATVTIINKAGLHARAAAKLVGVVSRFESTVQLGIGDKLVDGKSIMALLMLAAVNGSQLRITVEGPDEKDAASAIILLINNRFEEDE